MSRSPLAHKPRNAYYGNKFHSAERRLSIALEPYVLDTLMPDLVGHDRQPSAFLVYLLLWRAAQRGGRHDVTIALQDIAEGTGLSKRTVQAAVAKLVSRRLVSIRRRTITATPTYTVLRPWKR